MYDKRFKKITIFIWQKLSGTYRKTIIKILKLSMTTVPLWHQNMVPMPKGEEIKYPLIPLSIYYCHMHIRVVVFIILVRSDNSQKTISRQTIKQNQQT